MTAITRKNFARAMKLLQEIGLLLQNGSEIPDVCRLVGARGIKGSWWADPLGPEIFAVSEMLADDPDVTMTRLVSGKVTFVHRSIWQKLAAVGKARDEWQMKNLSREAKILLREVDTKGAIRTDQLGTRFEKKTGKISRELELRLLLHAEQFHTEAGHHAKLLETWDSWAERARLRNKPINPLRAQHFLENRLKQINDKYSGSGHLPWLTNKS